MNTRKPLHRPLGDTEYMLEQWGWWRMDGKGIPSYTSPTFAVMRGQFPSSAKAYSINDELAVAVDGALAKLCRRDRDMGDMVWLYYGAKWPASRVGRHYNVSEMKARELIKAGVAWIDCVLDALRQAA
ncbi:antiterminator Q family protein [Pseudomonas fluorescens]|uniref:antiterminator Q family protein n=1 Tax=Pseudomonas fluorescens TaxID=294 RepID=UPI00124034FB|nr:antiterminator Q family protein [Pseudomonas fluorescens]